MGLGVNCVEIGAEIGLLEALAFKTNPACNDVVAIEATTNTAETNFLPPEISEDLALLIFI